ncbi:MAG: hypothetical protein ACFFB5_20420 [Promethearchaeota archaeon]
MKHLFSQILTASDARNTSYFLDVVITYSFLQFHWFLLAFVCIILIEAVVYYIFWRGLITSFKVSIVTNICSSLVAVPFLLLSDFSSWLELITTAELFITEEEITRLFDVISIIFIFFVTTCLVSIFIELNIGNLLKPSQENDLKVYAIANSITYTSIIIILVSMGLLFGITNQDPTLNSNDFFNDWLFLSLDADYVPDFFSIFSGYAGLIESIFVLIIIVVLILYIRSTKSSVSTPPPEDK